jgi:hypothetical protein
VAPVKFSEITQKRFDVLAFKPRLELGLEAVAEAWAGLQQTRTSRLHCD